jgi:hypothetical protein
MNGIHTEQTTGPAKLRALVVDGRASRLAAFKSSMNGCVELFSAQGPLEAFYWAERLRTVDCLILHHPSAISAKPLDLIRSLQDSLQDVDKMVKVLVIDPDEAADLQNSILITPSDLVLTEPLEIEDLCKEVRKRLARLIKEKRTSLRVPIPEDQPIKVEVDGEKTAVLRDLSETGMFLDRRRLERRRLAPVRSSYFRPRALARGRSRRPVHGRRRRPRDRFPPDGRRYPS